ncbi:hypothetical protein JOQ06_009537 [Pogonophryne albipinna]|uniref:Uncharacterized protein n=1 Tax=Pogonophryne albipinna TaxID=1090488 RepID=A0AAD6BSG2_9TELE|nr:hypothetical protein JOQ06_009537 [Pogonophryne albipinna]
MLAPVSNGPASAQDRGRRAAKKRVNSDADDELRDYCQRTLHIPTENVHRVPRLTKLSRSYLAIPATGTPMEHATAVFTALPLLFPSNTVPPRKLGTSREALFHILTTSEDPETFLRQRSLSCPVVLVSEENCMIAVGSTPLTTFQKEQFDEGLLYLMAYYYAMHLTYPNYKKAIGEWKAFIE